MKKMDNEIILGGIFGAIAVAATIFEMALNGFEAVAVAGGIKDISGTMVAVLVFIIAIKQYIKSKPKKAFEDRMNYALDKWCSENSNMIVRNKSIDGDAYGIGMKTDVRDFYRKVAITNKPGRFVQMPLIARENYENGNITLNFSLNKSTFFSNIKDTDLTPRFQELNDLFCGLINYKFNGFASAGGKNKEIKVEIKQPIVTDADIARFIDVINTMYQAYLVSANLGD